jgi:hypothetical protein
MLPLAVFAPGFTPPVRAPVTVAVTTEGVRRVALDTRTFNARWIPVRDMPHAMPAALVYRSKPIPDTEVEELPLPRPRPYIRALPTPARDLCARHKMRKVMVGKYKWRCRR